MNELDESFIQHLYGRWLPMSPVDVAALFDRAPFPWWIAGGLAIEAAGGARRPHWDTDVAVLRHDLEARRDWLADFHLWEVGGARCVHSYEAIDRAPTEISCGYGAMHLHHGFSTSC